MLCKLSLHTLSDFFILFTHDIKLHLPYQKVIFFQVVRRETVGYSLLIIREYILETSHATTESEKRTCLPTNTPWSQLDNRIIIITEKLLRSLTMQIKCWG